jgi:acyl carrier protein
VANGNLASSAGPDDYREQSVVISSGRRRIPAVKQREILENVLATIRARGVTFPIRPHDPLGADGLGLDSVAVAETLLDCEERFGVALSDLLSGAQLDVRTLVEAISDRVQPSLVS